MKYVRSKTDKIKVFPEYKHHRDFISEKSVKSAGKFKLINGEVKTFGKSFGFNLYPLKGDAELIAKKLK